MGDDLDLEALEMSVRSSMHQVGAVMLEEMINGLLPEESSSGSQRECGEEYLFWGNREKRLWTVLGEIVVRRNYYYHARKGTGIFPKDRALGIEGTLFSPGVRRMMARTGASRPFAWAAEDLKELAGLSLEAKEVERSCHSLGPQVETFLQSCPKEEYPRENVVAFRKIPLLYISMDGTGVPMVKKETEGRAGKGEEGWAKTREVKLGCVFTQSGLDSQGNPVRDENSTSYVGAIETAEKFSDRLYQEALRRGLWQARKVCVLGDGAVWIWNIADLQFPEAIKIVDLFHAQEHIWNVAKEIYPRDRRQWEPWARERIEELEQGDPEVVSQKILAMIPSVPQSKEMLEKEANYFERNRERMRYAQFRKQGLFVGSGVLEAGCRSVIGSRLKQSGMHWTVSGANAVIALRCCIESNRWEDFWEYCSSA